MQYPFSLSSDLKRNPYHGRYFAFEGIDGSGKSTQVEKVKRYLEKKRKTVAITSEPMQKGKIQEVIRDALFSKIKIPSRAYQNIYSADRGVNHATIVEPALKKGNTVLSHRSFWSAVAYGILDLGEDYSFKNHAWPIFVAQGIFSNFHQFLAPDKTFYLKISASGAIERLQKMDKTKDIYEKGEKLAKIVHGYDTLVTKFPEEFIVIDGEQNEDSVFHEIISYIDTK